MSNSMRETAEPFGILYFRSCVSQHHLEMIRKGKRRNQGWLIGESNLLFNRAPSVSSQPLLNHFPRPLNSHDSDMQPNSGKEMRAGGGRRNQWRLTREQSLLSHRAPSSLFKPLFDHLPSQVNSKVAQIFIRGKGHMKKKSSFAFTRLGK